ncbi:Spy/CpxP family protein refolding chaperone [Acidovorax sp. NCPPB 3576]|uniref:Spy/CpxP family protein refolding chaperone n=1 Tax=Acidovorax sp. NCPPB 3576 TaxID=2940488 RepID=UPI002349E824|nr:Spy/CpxP family protein refolding chaperone [Acidovorax sp. NCPPB 3576]WCM88371.1 Spy/CpxP family protein refolding chaperone [Acidovorax sp. NCPPB 3576]
MSIFFQRRIAGAAAATALLAALAAPAFAQTPVPAPSTPPAAGQSQDGPRHRMPSPEQRKAHMEQRANALQQKLQLTPAQQPAWETFKAAMQPQERGARLDPKGLDQLTTPERIDRMRAMRAQHSAEADRRDEATKAFYAALTPAQQKTFDQESRRMHRHPGMGGPRDGEHGKDGRHGGPRGDRPAVPPVPAPAPQ